MNITRAISLLSPLCITLASLGALQGEEQPAKKPNVLFIVCDDLNDYVTNYFGHPQARTPALEKLAASGTIFTNAHTNAGYCAPSRASLMTGVAPWQSGTAMTKIDKHPDLKHCKSLPLFFKENGYYSVGTGKIFHGGNVKDWSKCHYGPQYGPQWFNGEKTAPHPGVTPPFSKIGGLDGSFGPLEETPEKGLGDDGYWRCGPIPGSENSTKYVKTGVKPKIVFDPEKGYMTPDKVNSYLIKDIISGKKGKLKEPFFMSVGFVRPHTPLHAEKKFFDEFPEDTVKLTEEQKIGLKSIPPLPKDGKDPKTVNMLRAISQMSATPEGGLVKYTRAYLACIKAADDNIKRVLEALDKSSYKDNTIVIVISDHGWHNGEHGRMQKNSPWEETCRVPFIVRVPGMTKPGTECNHPVSLIDIYPTLIDLCGLKGKTYKEGGLPLAGHSLRGLLEDPQNGSWKGPDIAVTCLGGWMNKNKYNKLPREKRVARLTYSVRSKRYRYIRYNNGKEELYDHDKDPFELTDLATDLKYDAVRKQHLESLNKLTGFNFPVKERKK